MVLVLWLTAGNSTMTYVKEKWEPLTSLSTMMSHLEPISKCKLTFGFSVLRDIFCTSLCYTAYPCPISSNKHLWRLINFEALRGGAYFKVRVIISSKFNNLIMLSLQITNHNYLYVYCLFSIFHRWYTCSIFILI